MIYVFVKARVLVLVEITSNKAVSHRTLPGELKRPYVFVTVLH